MSDPSTDFEAQVRADVAELARLLAGIGEPRQRSVELPVRTDSPLADLYAGIRSAAEKLERMAEEHEQRLQEARAAADRVQAQSETIAELSTPVLRVLDGILIMPLIGVVDTARAQQVMEALLRSIVAAEASVAIVDVTGVFVLDTTVANHFLNLIHASRLIGAKLVLSGVGPHNAQTLVKLGVDLSQVTTKLSLQSALKHAIELVERERGQ